LFTLGDVGHLYEDGYPAQVNARFPSNETEESAETLPGVAMRTATDDKYARAESGFAPSGVSEDDDGAAEGEAGGGGSPFDGLLDLFGGGLDQLAAGDEPAAGDLNNPLATVVDLAGYASVARTTAVDGPVIANSRAVLGEVHLLSGQLTIGGVEARARTETDGETGQARGRASYGTLSIADQEFSIGPDGAIVPEEESPIPLLDQLPGDALEALGVTFQVPEPVRDVDGDTAFSVSEGLRVYIDLGVLAPVLQALPTAEFGDALPDDLGPLKSLVGGLGNLAPVFVITLGTATAWVDTVPPIDFPATDDAAAPGGPDAAAGGAEPPAAGSGGAAGGDVPAPPAPGNNPPTADVVGDLTDAAPTSNLPPLFSIPGLLLMAALALGGLVGNWMRIMGAKVLGGGAAYLVWRRAVSRRGQRARATRLLRGSRI
jgi:hypothetical protein